MIINYQFVSYLWITFALTLIILGVLLYIWTHRTAIRMHFLLITLVLVEVWIVAQGLEMAALDLPVKIMWANIQYIPIMLTPVTYFCIALQLTRHDKWLQKRWLVFILLLMPIAMNILLWTNDFHSLIRQNVHLDYSGSFPTVGKTYGPLFWPFAIYNFALTAITLLILATAAREKISYYRRQITFLFLSLLLPVISTAFQVTGENPFPVDTTPAVFGISAIILSLGIIRYRLFDVIPIARSLIIQEMSTGMIVLDNEGRLLDINPAARKVFGLEGKRLIGLSVTDIFAQKQEIIRIFKAGKDDACEVTVEGGLNREFYEVSLKRIASPSEKFIGWLMQIYNITERKSTEEIIQHAAFHDTLTGIPNRSYFQILFSQRMVQVKRRDDTMALAYLDLDDFKLINDNYGHDAGDRVLCEFATRLKGLVRDTDIVARIGGDEFVIALPHAGSDERIGVVAQKIIKMLETDIELPEASVQVKASIGFSVYPRDGEKLETLLKKADQAMYRVKDNTKNNYYIYKE